MRRIAGIGLLLLVAGTPGAIGGGQRSSVPEPPRVLSSHAINGQFIGFCRGDYSHVVVQPAVGRPRSFWLWTNSPDYLDYFLAMHQGASIRARYEVTDTYIPEAAGRQVIDVLVDVTVGRTGYKAWYAKERHAIEAQGPERVERFVRSRIIECSSKAFQK